MRKESFTTPVPDEDSKSASTEQSKSAEPKLLPSPEESIEEEEKGKIIEKEDSLPQEPILEKESVIVDSSVAESNDNPPITKKELDGDRADEIRDKNEFDSEPFCDSQGKSKMEKCENANNAVSVEKESQVATTIEVSDIEPSEHHEVADSNALDVINVPLFEDPVENVPL